MIGTRLAHYEITAHLGSGGFGDVYQATDTKLGRSVAIKVLPEPFARDTDRASRFEREARVLASLNHPNIAAIHGFEDSDGRKFLVMELVPGETLQARLKRGPIPVDEALSIAKHIAEALEAAHEKGVIHRDLKPGNVMLTGEGQVKVLDFGLAKAYETTPSNVNLSNSPTMASMAATNAGVILGTRSIMSPEQAKGRNIDRRTDIFAFGCVLYEMLTGKPAFDGEDTADILGSVLKSEPDWTKLPARVPSGAHQLLRLCLEKNPRNRRDSAADVRLDLEEALNEPRSAVLSAVSPRSRQRIAGLVVTIGVFTLVGVAIGLRLRNAVGPSTPPIQFTVSAPNGRSEQANGTVSPDGRWVTFETGVRGNTTVWLRPTDSSEARELAGAHGASQMFWAPDSKQLAFFADRKVKTIEVLTGVTRVLTDVPSGTGTGGDWNRDGVILFGCATGIYRVASRGGPPLRVDLKDGADPESQRLTPRFLPDGEHFLYGVPKLGSPERSVQLGSIKSLEARLLLETESAAQYVPPGYVLFVKGGTLWAQSFDSAKLSLIGEAQPIAASVQEFFASQNGVLLFKRSEVVDSDLVWIDKNGKEIGKIKKPLTGTYANPSLAPDGRRVAVNSLDPRTGKWDIWIVDSTRDVVERFTLGGGSNKDPVWSPDGQQIAFFSNRENHFGLYVKSVGGAAVEQMVSDVGVDAVPTDWSPDGKFIVYSAANLSQLRLLSLSDHKSTRLLPTEDYLQFGARFSHDGKWIAYHSDESGRLEIYIQDFPNLTRRHLISDTGGIHPRWGKDDTEIYYHNMSRPEIDVSALRRSGADLTPEAPRSAFDRPVPVVGDGRNQYTISADGQRFLVRQPTGSTAVPSLTVIVNWPAALDK